MIPVLVLGGVMPAPVVGGLVSDLSGADPKKKNYCFSLIDITHSRLTRKLLFVVHVNKR